MARVTTGFGACALWNDLKARQAVFVPLLGISSSAANSAGVACADMHLHTLCSLPKRNVHAAL